MQDEIRDLMYASFERELNEEEQKKLDEALEHSQILGKEHQELTELRETAGAAGDVSFTPFFADRVMERITFLEQESLNPSALFDSLRFAFRKVAVGAALACLVLLFFNLRSVEQPQTAQATESSEVYMEDVFEQYTMQVLEGIL
ncbi:MAG: hypothetical protein ACYTEU_09445 [Planctomycetota bacterium]|jgi:hypothetical protein